MSKLALKQLIVCGTFLAASSAMAGVIATFDNLSAPPALDSASGLQWTNGADGLLYQGVTWDSRFSVVGDEYRVGGTGGPLFGIPHSGHYFVSNQDGSTGMTVNTDKVLTGAWFGRNQYYGFGEGGADQVTIVALNGATELGSVVFDLPESHPGLPEPLSFVDTSIFASLGKITGYRIDRRELGQQSGNWVADDFTFADAAQVPAPGGTALMLGGLAALMVARRRRA
ncbi:hypothetical protein GM658_19055 [Pseudoduganella eburnea]|uniref:PEP-CTERM sorting domain-containing protein n=1 Tax=Massilia eburnea TaxID=1776165 RepID=A0A6L6QKR5_9BURK|nr:hypothetical protein [Massilia eburnea]MTW12710.1 hypothetical protein [Massilia eburnea]